MSRSLETARLDELERVKDCGALTQEHMAGVLQLAQSMFGVAGVAITYVDAHGTQSCAHIGPLVPDGMARDQSFCAHTIARDQPLIVEDARADARFAAFDAVLDTPYIRFYAGAPIVSPKGYHIGAVCLVDTVPRAFPPDQAASLEALAALAASHITMMAERHEAQFDPLTGLLNRDVLHQAIDDALANDHRVSAMLIDLDGFKEVNDSLGHRMGDEVLETAAARIRACAGNDHLVARLGGDEFVVFLDGVSDVFALKALADAIVAALSEPFTVNGHVMTLGASVGVVTHSVEGDASKLLGNADLAMYQAKTDGRGRSRMFTRDMRKAALERGNLLVELQGAWEEGALELYYQPLVTLADGAWSGAEALLRWNYPYRGVLSPAMFLPILEQSHLAIPVGTWIIEEACRQAALWRRSHNPDFTMSVNLFEVQFQTGDLKDVVVNALAMHGLPPEALTLEITERIILADDKIKDQLSALRNFGVGIALDDFGTGYASLSALKDFPVSAVKIDRMFVANAPDSAQDRAIIDALLYIAKVFKLDVTAEGIETPEQQSLLRAQPCRTAQGFLYGRPIKSDEFVANWPARASKPALRAS